MPCAYCHVAEGRGGRNDFAADEKTPKKTARVMMKMVTNVNEQIAAGVGKPAADVTKVSCATCHRGSAIPTEVRSTAASRARRRSGARSSALVTVVASESEWRHEDAKTQSQRISLRVLRVFVAEFLRDLVGDVPSDNRRAVVAAASGERGR